MKKIILTIMIGIFLLTVVSAIDDDYLGKQWENINITETCSVDGFKCDSTYGCNITIVNPNQNIIILEQVMTRNDSIYNYTLTNTDVLGLYKVKTYCGNGTFSGENIDGTLEVTTTGSAVNPTLTIIILLSALIFFIIALVIKNFGVAFLSGILFLISGINIMIYGLVYVSDLYTRAIGIVILGFGILISITSGVEGMESA